jgi:hypothetical protein
MNVARLRNLHSHDDDRLTVGCPECIRATRAAEEVARWEQAPLRTVTWTFSYDNQDGETSSLVVELVVEVPDDATSIEIDERHAHLTGSAFLAALPDSLPGSWTDHACSTMEVESVKIGALLEAETPTVSEPSLFGPWGTA